jgi:hypothetical protein
MLKRAENNVVITITYGSPREAFLVDIINSVAEKLSMDGINTQLLQVYIPGSKPLISINGVYLDIESVMNNGIEEKAYEALIEEITRSIIDFLENGVAALIHL